jgi:hypothetical protein
MEQHVAEYFCKQHLNEEQKVLLAFRAARQDPHWTKTVEDVKREHAREMAVRVGWFVDVETHHMADMFEAFDEQEMKCTTNEKFVVCKVEGGELRSVRFTYSLKAWFYCGGSKNSVDEEADDFAAELVGPQLTTPDYDSIVQLIIQRDKDRFLSVAEEMHEALLEHLTDEAWAETSAQAKWKNLL